MAVSIPFFQTQKSYKKAIITQIEGGLILESFSFWLFPQLQATTKAKKNLSEIKTPLLKLRQSVLTRK